MSSVAAAPADTPEEFAALADEVVEDFMSDATSNEVFSTAEGHGEVSAYEIMFFTDPHVQDHRVTSRVALLPRRVLQNLLCDAGFREPVWQTRLRRATTASLAEEVGDTAAVRNRSASSKRRSPRTRSTRLRCKRYGRPFSHPKICCRTSSELSMCTFWRFP